MAIANTYQTYQAKGLREELSDIIYDISPMDTPVVSMSPKTKAKQTLFEWQTDSLAAATDDNAQVEGFDVDTFPAIDPTVRVGNYTQISEKHFLISDTQEVVDKAGRNSEIARETAKKGREMKRDMEKMVLANEGGAAGGASTARKTAKLGAWIKTNVNFEDGGTTPGSNPTYTSGVPGAARGDAGSGDLRAFTEAILKDVAQQIWTSGGDLHTLFVGPYNKTVVSGFTGVVTRNFDMSNVDPAPTAVISAIDVYVTDFGTLRVVPNRFQRERDAWFLDPEYLALPHLRGFKVQKLAKTGDAEKRLLVVEWGLKVKQEAALGLAADLKIAA